MLAKAKTYFVSITEIKTIEYLTNLKKSRLNLDGNKVINYRFKIY